LHVYLAGLTGKGREGNGRKEKRRGKGDEGGKRESVEGEG